MGQDYSGESPFKWFVGLALLVLALFGLAFGARGLGLVHFQFWAPKEEAARREVFEESKSYRDGMNQELRSMQLQYVTASPEHQDALRSIILHRVAGFPEDALQNDIAVFVHALQQEQYP